MASDTGIYSGFSVESEAAKLCPPDRETNQVIKMQTVEAIRTEGQPAVEINRFGQPPIHFVQKSVLGHQNTVTTCQFCQAHINTAIKYTVTTRTHITAALCSFICCCCCLPYCMDSAKNTDHYCPACQRYLGTYEK